MYRVLLKDWKWNVLQFFAIVFTVATMGMTVVENNGYAYSFSLIAIFLIGFSVRRAAKVVA